MLKIFDLKDKMEYIEEVSILTQKEWGELDDFDNRVKKKIDKIKRLLNTDNYVKLILLDDDKLIGFISIFETDGDEYMELTPWYSTMYIKKEYRGLGYSKILNKAILDIARKKGYRKIYLKSSLNNYYEKFGAIYMNDLKNGEKLYYIDL